MTAPRFRFGQRYFLVLVGRHQSRRAALAPSVVAMATPVQHHRAGLGLRLKILPGQYLVFQVETNDSAASLSKH
jgi:hypothetical protein